MIELTLRQDEARLVYLAAAYHLGRPGSELDPITKQPVEHGLAEVARAMQPQLRMALTTIELNDDQAKRLLSAMLGTITELKAYTMLELRVSEDGSGRRSTVPGFDATLTHLFPEVEEDAENALDVAEQMLLARRRLDQRLAAVPPASPAEEKQPDKKPWWRLGR
jgi:hypothetical protein